MLEIVRSTMETCDGVPSRKTSMMGSYVMVQCG